MQRAQAQVTHFEETARQLSVSRQNEARLTTEIHKLQEQARGPKTLKTSTLKLSLDLEEARQTIFNLECEQQKLK